MSEVRIGGPWGRNKRTGEDNEPPKVEIEKYERQAAERKERAVKEAKVVKRDQR